MKLKVFIIPLIFIVAFGLITSVINQIKTEHKLQKKTYSQTIKAAKKAIKHKNLT